MRPPFYLRQLRRDLDTWIAKGLVDEDNKEAILNSVGAGAQVRTLDVILAVFGVILIGAGAMSFVGANWDAMGKLERLIVLFGSLWAAYGAAIWFLNASRTAVGEALVLLGVILFGVNIHFVAQTYNIQAHYPDGLLLWGLGAIAAAALVPSRGSLALALGLGGWWTFQETFYFDMLHLPFIAYWAVCAAISWALSWRPGVHLSALTLLGWFLINSENIQQILGWNDVEVLTLYIFIPLAIWSFAQLMDRDANGLALSVGHYAFFVFLIAYGALQIPKNAESATAASSWLAFASLMTVASVGAVALGFNRKIFTPLDVAGTLFVALTTIAYVFLVRQYGDALDVLYLIFALIVIIWSIQRGVRLQDRFVINWSTVAFGLWFLYAYFDLFEGLLDQSLFFTVGGILLILLSLTLEAMRRRLIAPEAGPKEATP